MPQSMPLCALMEGASWSMRVLTNGYNAPFSLRLSRPLACDRLMKSGLRFTLRHKKFPLASAKQGHPSPKHHHSLHAPTADTCRQRKQHIRAHAHLSTDARDDTMHWIERIAGRTHIPWTGTRKVLHPCGSSRDVTDVTLGQTRPGIPCRRVSASASTCPSRAACHCKRCLLLVW